MLGWRERRSGVVMLFVLATGGMAQANGASRTAPNPGGPTTTLPLSYPRRAAFTTDEGTWMSLDVSPDGRTIVFDLAGDLYTLPIGGGKAARITDGPGYDAQPRFSPDGTRILFVSDRSGAENLYTVRPDGRGLKALTVGEGRDYMSPTWTPDGQHIVVSVSRGNWALYLYREDGGEGTELMADAGAESSGTSPGNDEFIGAAFGRDPRWLYFSHYGMRYENPYNQKGFRWKIQRYSFETGEREDVAIESGGAMRPVLSPDGRWLVYATRRDTVTSLRLLTLETGEVTWLLNGVQRDDQESRYTRDLMPGSAFTPDSRALITAFNGKIWRVEVPAGTVKPIPFSADVEVQLGERVRFTYPINDSLASVQQIRDPRLSPDNRRVAFTAFGRLYVMELPDGTPQRLTRATVREHHPAWSPDGQWVAYVTWDDSLGGAVYRVRADGSAAPERLTREPGFYRRVAYNPSGSRLVVLRAPWRPTSRFTTAQRGAGPGALVWLPAIGGALTVIQKDSTWRDDSEVRLPYFVDGDSTRIYQGLQSCRWDGTECKTHLRSRWFARLSPNGKRVFARAQWPSRPDTLYLGTVPFARALPFDITAAGAPLVARQAGTHAVDFPAWSPDGTKLIWAAGRYLFIYDVARGDSLVADSMRQAAAREAEKRAGGDWAQAGAPAPGSAAKAPAAGASGAPVYEAERLEVRLTVPTDRPRGVVALRRARIITMQGDTVLERGDIVIDGSRIVAVGPSGRVRIPAGATRIDLRGKTIIPGLIDVHAHPQLEQDVHPTQPWQYAAALAYGITTIRDPAPWWRFEFLSYSDMVAGGAMLGPRIYSTGEVIGKGDFSTRATTREVLRRYAEFYGTKTIKKYEAGNRRARQHILLAAKELGLTPTLEGGLDFKRNITEAVDGYAGSEHSYPITPLYKDIVELIARSGITYTPTLLVSYGGPHAENYMYEKYQAMHDDPKLQRFVPHGEIDSRFRRRSHWFADGEYVFRRLAEQATKIVRAGGRVGLGGHGQLPGLGEHWELWLLQSGGMSPLEALRCATLFGAEALGLERDLGSLAPGKLADLVVLDQNPLEHIEHTLTVRYVMKNGRLYDGNTLETVWPSASGRVTAKAAASEQRRPTCSCTASASSPMIPTLAPRKRDHFRFGGDRIPETNVDLQGNPRAIQPGQQGNPDRTSRHRSPQPAP